MRRILIDAARAKTDRKRGGGVNRRELDDPAAPLSDVDQDLLLDLDDHLSELEAEDPEAASLVKLRLFAGLSTAEAGRILGMSRKIAYSIQWPVLSLRAFSRQ